MGSSSEFAGDMDGERRVSPGPGRRMDAHDRQTGRRGGGVDEVYPGQAKASKRADTKEASAYSQDDDDKDGQGKKLFPSAHHN